MQKKINRLIPKLIIILSLMLVLSACREAGQKTVEEPLPVDPSIVQGQLDNGLKYYIVKNNYPDDIIELRLNVRTGSLNETEEERGLAHFCEHMAFNGTKHFGGNGVIEFMEDLGLTFGKHTNAYTGTDVTNYRLTVPIEKKEMFDKSLVILRDWADGLLFNPEEIEKEKGVITEEWRMRDDYRSRIRKEKRKILLAGSKYTERDPIGLMEVVQGADRELLKGYHDKWYTADNMSVIVVGNIDPADMEQKIKNAFGDMSDKKSPENTLKIVPLTEGFRYSKITDEDAKSVTFSMNYIVEHPRPATYEEYKTHILEQGVSFMFNRRIDRRKLENKTNLYYMKMFPSQISENLMDYVFTAALKEDEYKENLKEFFTEIERVKRYGFQLEEVKEFEKVVGEQLERRAREDKVFASSELADNINRYDTYGGDLLSPKQELEAFRRTIASLNITSFNRAVEKVLGTNSKVAFITMPESQKDKILLSKAEIENIISETSKAEISEASVLSGRDKLIENTPKPVKIVKKEHISKFNADLYEFANGTKLIVRPSDLKKHEYLLSGIRMGGYSDINDLTEFLATKNLSTVVGTSGFKDLSKNDVVRILAGHKATVKPVITPYYEGFNGGGDTDDLEMTFQLLNLYMTSFDVTEDSYKPAEERLAKSIENEQRDRFEMFMRDALPELYNDNYRRSYLLADDLKKFSDETFESAYENIFGGTEGYVFAIAGDVDSEKTAELFAKYIGSIPATGEGADRNKYIDRDVRFAKSGNRFEGAGSVEHKTTVVLRFENEHISYSNTKLLSSYVLTNILNKKLREEIREKLGGVYNISGSFIMSWLVDNYASGSIKFTCSPERTEELIAVIHKTLDNIKNGSITEEEVESAKSQIKLSVEQQLKGNKFWSNYMPLVIQTDIYDWKIGNIEEEFRPVTVKSVTDFIKSFKEDDKQFTIIFNPEA